MIKLLMLERMDKERLKNLKDKYKLSIIFQKIIKLILHKQLNLLIIILQSVKLATTLDRS